jgi:pimeloyl-ACP methyl ester carboxylesterase
MRQLEIERGVVVGYSDGGIIGLDMAIHHPAPQTAEADVDGGAKLHARAPAEH